MAEFEAIMIIVSERAVLCLPLVIFVCIGMYMFLFCGGIINILDDFRNIDIISVKNRCFCQNVA